MATTSRVTPWGWEQGDDSADVSRVTPGGWEQVVGAGGGTDGNASTAPASSTLTAPTATGSGSAQASTAPAGSTLTAPTATASASAQASGALASASLTAPTATATGTAADGYASGEIAGMSLSAPTATASNGLQSFGGGWDELISLRRRRNSQEPIVQAVEAAIVQAVEAIPAPKKRQTLTLSKLVGKQAAAQISTADARRMRRKRDDEFLLLM